MANSKKGPPPKSKSKQRKRKKNFKPKDKFLIRGIKYSMQATIKRNPAILCFKDVFRRQLERLVNEIEEEDVNNGD